MKSIVKRVCRYSINKIKFLQVKAHQKQEVKIVHWHGVGEDNIYTKGLKVNIPANIFFEQIRYIKNHYSVISLEDYIKAIELERCHTYNVVLTFDDCYRNLLLNAIPVLKKYNLPATIFVNSMFVGNKKLPWFVKLAYMVNIGEGKLLYDSFQDRFQLKNSNGKYGYDNLLSIALKNNTFKVDEICDHLLKNLGFNVRDLAQEANLFWDLNDFFMVDKDLFSFGNHTASHPILSSLDAVDQRREIHDGKEFLTDNLGVMSPPFAVPNGGRQDLGDFGKEIVKETGHSCLLYAEGGTNAQMSNKYNLMREMILPLKGRLFSYSIENYEPF